MINLNILLVYQNLMKVLRDFYFIEWHKENCVIITSSGILTEDVVIQLIKPVLLNNELNSSITAVVVKPNGVLGFNLNKENVGDWEVSIDEFYLLYRDSGRIINSVIIELEKTGFYHM